MGAVHIHKIQLTFIKCPTTAGIIRLWAGMLLNTPHDVHYSMNEHVQEIEVPELPLAQSWTLQFAGNHDNQARLGEVRVFGKMPRHAWAHECVMKMALDWLLFSV